MHGGMYTGPGSPYERRESLIRQGGSFIFRKLGEAANLLLRRGSPDKDSKSQQTAFGGSAPKDFEVIATPRKVEMTGGSLEEGESVFLHGVQRPQDPNIN